MSDRKDAVPSGNAADPVASYTTTIISANDYYPFGLLIDERSSILSNAKGHRYGFNGKEKDSDGEFGSNTTYDYGFRIYNPAIAKFLSVDPLTKSYPELTPYQFASNTPIQAIDLDGLEAFFVHGTTGGPEAWETKLSKATREEIMKLTNNTTEDIKFGWNVKSKRLEASLITGKSRRPHNKNLNRGANNENDRLEAANLLAKYVNENATGREEVTLVGFSHGGNFSIQAAKILRDKYGFGEVNIITVNTPSFNEPYDPENPSNTNSNINDMISLYTPGDRVAGGLSPGSEDAPSENIGSDRTARIRVFEITHRNETGGPLNNHYLNNVDPASIKNLNIDKLKPAPKAPKKSERYK